MVDSNHRSKLQQIYSLSPLATRETTHILKVSLEADDRTRTDNLLITNQLLCQLSHIGISCFHKKWDLQGSNLWPSACKADALPAELRSRKKYDLETYTCSKVLWVNTLVLNDPDGVRTHDLRRDRAAL